MKAVGQAFDADVGVFWYFMLIPRRAALKIKKRVEVQHLYL